MNTKNPGDNGERSQEERAREFARILEQQKREKARNSEVQQGVTEKKVARRRTDMPRSKVPNKVSRGKKAKQKRRRRLIRRICILILILVTIVLLGWFLIDSILHHFAGKLQQEDPDSISTLAANETLDETEEGLESTAEPITDSPSEEIAQLQSQINIILQRNTTEAPEETEETEESFSGKPVETEAPTLAPDLKKDGIINILLIGIDARGKLNGRSDAIILLTINEKQEKIYLTSIMRDVYVAIPDRSGDRINSSYAYGGAPLLLKTIETNFGVHIDYYARVDFFSFITGVDVVGGVDIEINDEERYWLNEYLNEINGLYGRHADTYKLPEGQIGVQHLNGSQALAYARIRYVGSDYARTQRQRNVINAAVKQMKSQSLSGIVNSLNEILPLITTNIPEDMLVDLAWSAPALMKYEIVEERVPHGGTGKSVTIDGKSVISVDFDYNSQMLQGIVNGTNGE